MCTTVLYATKELRKGKRHF